MTERVPTTCNCRYCGAELTRNVLKDDNGEIIDYDHNGVLYLSTCQKEGIYVCDSCKDNLREENEYRIAPDWARRKGYPPLCCYGYYPKEFVVDEEAEWMRYRSATKCLNYIEHILDELCPEVTIEGSLTVERAEPNNPHTLAEVLFLYELRDAIKNFLTENDDVAWWNEHRNIDFVATNILIEAMCKLYTKEKKSREYIDNRLRSILEKGISTLNLVEKINSHQS